MSGTETFVNFDIGASPEEVDDVRLAFADAGVPADVFPGRFGSFEDAHAFCGRFFSWYNDEHRHSGIGFHTPADVHYGRAELVQAQRAQVLDVAHAEHPERFVRQPPTPPALPTIAWINEPKEDTATTQ